MGYGYLLDGGKKVLNESGEEGLEGIKEFSEVG